MVEFAAQESGYLAGARGRNAPIEAQGRIENIQELSGVAAETAARDPDAGLAEFLEQVSLVGEQDEYDEEESVVTLMTLHIAKGLEFPVVFIVGMEDGIFPHYRSMTDTAELEEERRLAYVGITRAQQRLYLMPRVEPHACSARRTTTRPRGSSARSRRHCSTRRSPSRVQRPPSRTAGAAARERRRSYSVVGLPGARRRGARSSPAGRRRAAPVCPSATRRRSSPATP